MRRPVQQEDRRSNMTGLRGYYEVSLELPSAEAKGVMRFGAGIGMIPASNSASDDHPGESIFEAVRKLGLRLEARKAPLSMIVVDHLEKTRLSAS